MFVVMSESNNSELLNIFNAIWRRGGDSNPRYPCEYAAFRVRCIQPLCHLSAGRGPPFGAALDNGRSSRLQGPICGRTRQPAQYLRLRGKRPGSASEWEQRRAWAAGRPAAAADAASVALALGAECARAAAGREMRRRMPEPEAGIPRSSPLRLDSTRRFGYGRRNSGAGSSPRWFSFEPSRLIKRRPDRPAAFERPDRTAKG